MACTINVGVLNDCSSDSEDVKFMTVDLNSSSSWFMSLDDDSRGNLPSILAILSLVSIITHTLI